jgi:hypothetical protein
LWIAWQLEEAGYKVVIQAWDSRPGSNFVLFMQRALEEAERIIAVLSPDYLNAPFPQAEWAAAFPEDPTGEVSRWKAISRRASARYEAIPAQAGLPNLQHPSQIAVLQLISI